MFPHKHFDSRTKFKIIFLRFITVIKNLKHDLYFENHRHTCGSLLYLPTTLLLKFKYLHVARRIVFNESSELCKYYDYLFVSLMCHRETKYFYYNGWRSWRFIPHVNNSIKLVYKIKQL